MTCRKKLTGRLARSTPTPFFLFPSPLSSPLDIFGGKALFFSTLPKTTLECAKATFLDLVADTGLPFVCILHYKLDSHQPPNSHPVSKLFSSPSLSLPPPFQTLTMPDKKESWMGRRAGKIVSVMAHPLSLFLSTASRRFSIDHLVFSYIFRPLSPAFIF